MPSDACHTIPRVRHPVTLPRGRAIFIFLIEITLVLALDRAQKSFPSGHTTTAAASGAFLALYLNAKLKVFADRRPEYWKLLVFFTPLLFPVLVGGALTVDNSHHWYDVLAGAVIGICGATAAFRVSYASSESTKMYTYSRLIG